MYDFAFWLVATVLLLVLEVVEAIRALWGLVTTGPGLVVLGALAVGVWAAVLLGHRRQRLRVTRSTRSANRTSDNVTPEET